MQWCRFQIGQRVSYGIVEDDRVTEVSGSPCSMRRGPITAVMPKAW